MHLLMMLDNELEESFWASLTKQHECILSRLSGESILLNFSLVCPTAAPFGIQKRLLSGIKGSLLLLPPVHCLAWQFVTLLGKNPACGSEVVLWQNSTINHKFSVNGRLPPSWLWSFRSAGIARAEETTACLRREQETWKEFALLFIVQDSGFRFNTKKSRKFQINSYRFNTFTSYFW